MSDLSPSQIALLRWIAVGDRSVPLPPRCGFATFNALRNRGLVNPQPGIGWQATVAGYALLETLGRTSPAAAPQPCDEYVETRPVHSLDSAAIEYRLSGEANRRRIKLVSFDGSRWLAEELTDIRGIVKDPPGRTRLSPETLARHYRRADRTAPVQPGEPSPPDDVPGI